MQSLQNFQSVVCHIRLVSQTLKHAHGHFLVNQVVFRHQNAKRKLFLISSIRRNILGLRILHHIVR